jgi:hypothetical protein
LALGVGGGPTAAPAGLGAATTKVTKVINTMTAMLSEPARLRTINSTLSVPLTAQP